MDKTWTCPDCGLEIPLSRLDEINAEREKKRIRIKAKKFVPCKGSGYHTYGIAGRYYSLTDKGKKTAVELEKMGLIHPSRQKLEGEV